MLITVYYHERHATDAAQDTFTAVASVSTAAPHVLDALEEAFEATQNIEGSWSRGRFYEDGTPNRDFSEAVTVLAPLPTHLGRTYGHRSSMTGDIFRVGAEWFICRTIGFEPIDVPANLA